MDLMVGKRIEKWNRRAQLRSEDREHDGKPDDVLSNALHLPIFSRRLRLALAGASIATSDIQYLPVRILDSQGRMLEGFEVANIVSRVRALNRKNAKGLQLDRNRIDPETGKPLVKNFWTAALRSDAITGHDMIRLLEFWPPIFVSSRFRKLFRSNGFTGATFDPVLVT